MKTVLPPLVNHHVVGQFAELGRSGHLAHAYLFTGERGSGKFATALAVAKVLNCETGSVSAGCVCASCHKIDAGNHPDLFIIEKSEEKTEIVIGQITPRPNQPYQPLLPWLSVKALEARVRVVIIKDADLLNAEASNAFLKTLEEPVPGTLFILTTSVAREILPTVRSRCQQIQFMAPSYSHLAERPQSGYDGGLSARAKSADVFIDGFILTRLDDKDLKAFVEDKDEARVLIETVLTFYRDVLLVKMGVSAASLAYPSRKAEIDRLALKYSKEDIIAIIDQAARVMKGIKEGFNVKIALTLLKEMI
jgi:DNA polymerase III delta' subunit